MITLGIVAVICLAAGFGAGRVKNAAKLKAVSDVLTNIQTTATSDVLMVVTKLKSVL